MYIALAQINPIVGDLKDNCSKVIAVAKLAYDAGAHLVVFPELTLTGYPPDDLLEDAAFIEAEEATRAYMAHKLPQDIGCIIGGLARNTRGIGKPLFNAAFLYEKGGKVAEIHKSLLPTYDVFDESRYFEPSPKRHIVHWRSHRLGLHICEDLWNADGHSPSLYATDPVSDLAKQGADLLINICASPFGQNKHSERKTLIKATWDQHGLPYVFVNQVGANTGLIFDGRSCVWDGHRSIDLPAFEEALLIWDMDAQTGERAWIIHTGETSSQLTDADTFKSPFGIQKSSSDLELLRDALTLGIKDYYYKTGAFKQVFVGLSGGIDSAVTCALAVQALGSDKVTGVAMPSVYSSEGSVRDAHELAVHLGIPLLTIPIHSVVDAFGLALTNAFADTAPGTAEENIQARSRGIILMALANKFDGIVLATGNKSELAMGYATLYGDMNGALAILGDVFKTEVYALARLLNADGPCIPEATITKAPSAELRPNQTDQDSLPPYEVLDRVLKHYILHQQDPQTIALHTGIDLKLVKNIVRQVDNNEYKRHQAPPSLRVSNKAFGRGCRQPIVKRRTGPPAFASR